MRPVLSRNGAGTDSPARGLRRILRQVRFDDVAGALALFLLLGAGFWIGHGLGLPTGGAALTGVVR